MMRLQFIDKVIIKNNKKIDITKKVKEVSLDLISKQCILEVNENGTTYKNFLEEAIDEEIKFDLTVTGKIGDINFKNCIFSSTNIEDGIYSTFIKYENIDLDLKEKEEEIL